MADQPGEGTPRFPDSQGNCSSGKVWCYLPGSTLNHRHLDGTDGTTAWWHGRSGANQWWTFCLTGILPLGDQSTEGEK